jgi:hypothetical protein
MKGKQYEQMVKGKKTERVMELIKREDFLQAIESVSKVQIEGESEVVRAMSALLQIDAKYSEIYQVKSA